MPQVNFGAPQNLQTHGPSPYSDGIGMPWGRQMANGSQAVLITGLGLYISSTSGGNIRAASMSVGGAGTVTMNLPASGNASHFTGIHGTNWWLVQGGSHRVQAHSGNWGIRYAWGGGGSVNGGAGYRAGTLAGAYYYVQAPSAPRSVSATSPSSGNLTVNFIGPADNGETAITDYVVEIATDPQFTAGLQRTTNTSGTVNFSGLSPVTYYARVAARNAVTNTAGTWGPYSNTAAVALAGAPLAPAAPAVASGPDLIHVHWTAANNNGAALTRNELQIATNSGFTTGVQLLTLDANATSATVASLLPSTNYFARVRGVNVVGNGAWSAVVNTTTPVRTFQDTVGMAAVSLSDGTQVELRSSGAITPVITLVRSAVTAGTAVTTIETVPTGTGVGQFATPAGIDGLALTADPQGNLYIIGRDGGNGNLLAKRWARSNATTWALSGSLSQAITPASTNVLLQFAAEYVGGTTPSLFVLTRRAGQVGAGNLAYATLNLSNLASSSGSLFHAFSMDPTFLSAPGTTGTPNGSKIDVTRLTTTGSRLAIAANGFAVVDVNAGIVSPVSKSVDGTVMDATKMRTAPVGAASFARVCSNGAELEITFLSTAGAVMNTQTYAALNAQGGGFTDDWDAYFNRQDNLLHIVYVADDSGRKVEEITVSPASYVISPATVLTLTMGAASSINTKLKVPSGLMDERRIIITSASNASGTQTLGALSDASGNVAPTSPSLNQVSTFDSGYLQPFSWVFGDTNISDSQSAYHLQVDNATTGVNVLDTGKVSATASTRQVAGGTLPNNTGLRWRVRTYDALDTVSEWSQYGTFKTSDDGAVTITAPATDNQVSDLSYQDITWTYTNTGSATQAAYRVRVYDNATNAVLQDTGIVQGTGTAYRVQNLISDVVQRVEVQVQSTDGLFSVIGTRLLTPSYAAPVPPKYNIAAFSVYIELQIQNEVTGSRPRIVANEIWKRQYLSGDPFIRIATIDPDSTYKDYAVAGDTAYEYFVRGLGTETLADSEIKFMVALPIEGAWIHDTASPNDTIRQFLYGTHNRSESYAVQGVPVVLLGREYPVVEFGMNESLELKLNVVIPSEEDSSEIVEAYRSMLNRRSTLLYRDSRGRFNFGTISGLGITDIMGATEITFTFTATNYTEEV